MAVDKILQIDLTEITRESADALTKDLDELIKQTTSTKQQTTKPKGKVSSLSLLSQKADIGTIISFSKNPLSFFSGFVTKLVPILGPALLATGVIAAFVKQVDSFQKEFIDRVDDRIDVFREKQVQAEIQAGLTQLILTTSTGGAEPRDAYNTFSVYNENQTKLETDFQIRNTSGVN